MPDKPAAIRGTFANFKLVPTRSQAQFVIEVPIEGADEALRALGGVPLPGEERWVAIARMKDEEKPKSIGDRALAQSHVLCEDPEFQTWFHLSGTLGQDRPIVVRGKFLKAWTAGDQSEAIAVLLRWRLRIDSRSELLTDEIARNTLAKIVLEFDRERGRAAEKRRG